ncbi:MAG: hypothetical protein EZS28_008454 [Streblomastix strix]|uniref:Uncharacterized protein n=1 Tax=Streblomastix strix TaxID=222440 RepID=A0A5J4WN55_9EUKA|nr:MAG: hypothetical protein EZS28_008454 [Streblomastix strix]
MLERDRTDFAPDRAGFKTCGEQLKKEIEQISRQIGRGSKRAASSQILHDCVKTQMEQPTAQSRVTQVKVVKEKKLNGEGIDKDGYIYVKMIGVSPYETIHQVHNYNTEDNFYETIHQASNHNARQTGYIWEKQMLYDLSIF